MRYKIIGLFVCMLMIVTAFSAVDASNIQNTTPASPGLIGIRIIAKVYEVNDPDNLLGGVIQVNDTITGKYVYDSGTPDTSSNPNYGEYLMTSSSCGFEVNAGGLVFQTNPSDVYFPILIYNDYNSPLRDMYMVYSLNNLQLSNGMLVEWISWELDDDNCTALSSDALPTTAPVINEWEQIVGLQLTGEDPADPYKNFQIFAKVTKATKNNAVDDEPYPNILAPGFIGIKIVAKVFNVDDPDNLLGGVIKLNDTITGKYVYDSGTPDAEPDDPIQGKYLMTSSSCGIEVTAGGLIFKTNPSDVDFRMWIVNDYEYGYPHPDMYIVESHNNLQLSNGMSVNLINWQITNTSGTVFSNDALPTTAPVLSDWVSVYGLSLYGKDPSDPSKTFLVQAQVTKATKDKAIDIHGANSDWNAPSMKIPFQYTLPFMQFWMKLFERFPHTFPLLRHLMGY